MSKTIPVRIEGVMLAELDKQCTANNRSRNYLILEALMQYLKIDANKAVEATKPPEPIQTISEPQTTLKAAANESIPKWKLNVLAKQAPKQAKHDNNIQATSELAPDLHDIDTSELNNAEAF